MSNEGVLEKTETKMETYIQYQTVETSLTHIVDRGLGKLDIDRDY